MEADHAAAFVGKTVGMKTMASGATRLTVEFETEIKEELDGIWTSFASIGSSVAVALLSADVGIDEQRRRVIAAEKPSEASYGHVAKTLRRSGILTHKDVVSLLGSDNEYQEWCRGQRCVVTGEYDWNTDTGEARCEYAHVRRSNDSGVGIKPPYSGVPLCSQVHRQQHQMGELELLRRYPPHTPIKDMIAAHAWFNRKAQETLHRWAWERLKENIGADSMREVSAARLAGWFETMNIAHLCPLEIRQEADNEPH